MVILLDVVLPLWWEVVSLRTPQCVQSQFVLFYFYLPRPSFPPMKTDLSLLLLLPWPSLLGVFPLEQYVWELIYHPDFVTLRSRMKIAFNQRRESPAYSDNFSGVTCINGRKWAAVT